MMPPDEMESHQGDYTVTVDQKTSHDQSANIANSIRGSERAPENCEQLKLEDAEWGRGGVRQQGAGRSASHRDSVRRDRDQSGQTDRMIAADVSRSHAGRTRYPHRRPRYTRLSNLHEFAKSLTDDRCRRGCGRSIRRGDVGDADEILETTVHCDQAWLCPRCGYRASRVQSRELATT